MGVNSDGYCNELVPAATHSLPQSGCNGTCEYMFVSSVWNGPHGDAANCPLCNGGQGNTASICTFSITNLRISSSVVSGGMCKVLYEGIPHWGSNEPSTTISTIAIIGIMAIVMV